MSKFNFQPKNEEPKSNAPYFIGFLMFMGLVSLLVYYAKGLT
jgi:hypothetical protein